MRLYLPGAAYTSSQLESVYKHIDITVVPSAAGLTVIQSLQFGRPVVTHSDVYNQMPEFEAIVPGVTGDLFTRGDAEGLADVLERWVKRSSLERELIEDACRAAVRERWSPQAHASRIMEQLAPALLKKGGKAS